MKRGHILITILVSLCLGTQVYAYRGSARGWSLGLKGGVLFPQTSFSNGYYDYLSRSTMIAPVGGLFFECNPAGGFAMRFEFDYAERGGIFNTNTDKLSDMLSTREDFTPFAPGFMGREDYTYDLRSKNIDFRFALLYYFANSYNFQPYIFAVPYGSYRVAGTYKEGPKDAKSLPSEKLTTERVKEWDAGVMVGLGFRGVINTRKDNNYYIGIEANYGFGLLSNYPTKVSVPEGETPSVTPLPYSTDGGYGKRTNRGIEVGITFGFPFSNFKRDRYDNTDDEEYYNEGDEGTEEYADNGEGGEEEGYYDEDGIYHNADGSYEDEDGNVYDVEGTYIGYFDEDGNFYDTEGNLVPPYEEPTLEELLAEDTTSEVGTVDSTFIVTVHGSAPVVESEPQPAPVVERVEEPEKPKGPTFETERERINNITVTMAPQTANGDLTLRFTYSVTNPRINLYAPGDDYAPGAYLYTSSKGCEEMLYFLREKVERSNYRSFFEAGHPITVRIVGHADPTPVKNSLRYRGEFGECRGAIRQNGQVRRIFLTANTPVKDNYELAYLRTVDAERFIKDIDFFADKNDNVTIKKIAVIKRNDERDKRSVSVEIIVQGALLDEGW